MPPQATTPIWLDCDPGHDDAFAILLAAHHPALRLLGVSTVHGNASLSRTTANAGAVLTAVGRATDVPVYAGAARPFCRAAVHAPDIHGTSGLDGTDLLPDPSVPPRSDQPWLIATHDALLSVAEPWVVATGALTNVALLFAAFPELVEHIGGLSIMGGALGADFSPLGRVSDADGVPPRLGNITPWAEFNIYCDPEAAASLFSNTALAAKTVLIPLDLTHQILATPPVQALLHGLDHPPTTTASVIAQPSDLRRMLHHLLIFFADTYVKVFGIAAGPPLHDPVAVAAVLQAVGAEEIGFRSAPRQGSPQAGETSNAERWVVSVVTEPGAGQDGGGAEDGGRERGRAGELGRTKARRAKPGEAGVCVPRTVNADAFWRCLEAAVGRAEACAPAEGHREKEAAKAKIKAGPRTSAPFMTGTWI